MRGRPVHKGKQELHQLHKCRGCAATHGSDTSMLGRRETGSTPTWRPWSTFLIATGPLCRPRALGRHDGAPQATAAARGSGLLVSFSGEINTDGAKTPVRAPQRPPATIPSTPTAQHDDPIPLTTVGARVLDRDLTVFGGYHPSRRPVGTAHDRTQIGTKAARTSPESISGLHLPRRGAQGGVAPPATGYCRRRSGGGPKNAENCCARGAGGVRVLSVSLLALRVMW